MYDLYDMYDLIFKTTIRGEKPTAMCKKESSPLSLDSYQFEVCVCV